jgi:hypothetical protein
MEGYLRFPGDDPSRSRSGSGKVGDVPSYAGTPVSPADVRAERERRLRALVAQRHFGPRYDIDVAAWSRDFLDVHLWSKQVEVARSLVENRYTAVPACHDSGKSFFAAVAGCWWSTNHKEEETFLTSTAPTAPQVSAILWREIAALHSRGKLPGRITMGVIPEWKIGNRLIGFGRKPSDYDQSAFQGIHARFPVIIVDEAGGIPKQLWDAVDALATNENARVLAIGNPDDATSHFATICQPNSGWHVIPIDGLATPGMTEERLRAYPQLYQYFIDNEIPFVEEEVPDYLYEVLLSPGWVAERLHRWGPKSALWIAKVRGKFPPTGSEGIIPLAWVQAAINRWQNRFGVKADTDAGLVPETTTESAGPGESPPEGVPARYVPEESRAPAPFADPYYIPGRRVYAVDVARTGNDETALATRQGPVVFDVDEIGYQDTMETVNHVVPLLLHPQSLAIVDVIGVGAGVVDRLRELGQNVTPFNASERTDMRDRTGEFRFLNVRAAAWWNLRDMLDPSAFKSGAAEIELPPDEGLIEDLTVPTYKHLAGGIIRLQEKDEIRKRLGRSPDKGDAVVMAFWTTMPDISSSLIVEANWNTPVETPLKEFSAPWHVSERFEDFVPSHKTVEEDPFGDVDEWLGVLR